VGLIEVWIAIGFGGLFVVHKDQIIHGALVSASPCLYRMLNGLLRGADFAFLSVWSCDREKLFVEDALYLSLKRAKGGHSFKF
tara:strand:- start:1024 stop:1272 length:249 start_codon:yes stop_codon:yes gene_type:complete